MSMPQQRKVSTAMHDIVPQCHNVSLLNTGLFPTGTAGLLQSKALLMPPSSTGHYGPSNIPQIAILSNHCFWAYT